MKIQCCLIGIWLHKNGVLGSSPDGIVRQPALFGYCYQDPALADMLQLYNFRPEILEVKCPFSAKEMTIPEAIEKLNDFCLGWLQIWLMFFFIFQRLIYRVNYSKLYEQYVFILKQDRYNIYISKRKKSFAWSTTKKKIFNLWCRNDWKHDHCNCFFNLQSFKNSMEWNHTS